MIVIVKYFRAFICLFVLMIMFGLGPGQIVLQGVKIGKGSVVAAGAVVTKDIEPYSIVAGVPAKVIGKRNADLDYKCLWKIPFV